MHKGMRGAIPEPGELCNSLCTVCSILTFNNRVNSAVSCIQFLCMA